MLPVLVVLLLAPLAPAFPASAPADPFPLRPDTTMIATGTFEVEISPDTADEADGTTVGRMSLLKVFHGDLEGASRGTMLTATTQVEDSAGYVAIERVDGELHGRAGTFLLQHHGIMSGGEQSLTVVVVPDSGTGELLGIAGEMEIVIDGDGHHYELTYTLPE